MENDPIIEEIHAIREEIAKRYNYDLDAIVLAMNKASAEGGRQVISLPPRPVSTPPRIRRPARAGGRTTQ